VRLGGKGKSERGMKGNCQRRRKEKKSKKGTILEGEGGNDFKEGAGVFRCTSENWNAPDGSDSIRGEGTGLHVELHATQMVAWIGNYLSQEKDNWGGTRHTRIQKRGPANVGTE